MTRLSHQQWDALNSFALELHSNHTEEHFFYCCLDQIPSVIGQGFIDWDEFDNHFSLVKSRLHQDYEDAILPLLPAFQHTMCSHPVVTALGLPHKREALKSVYAITDFASKPTLESTAIYQEAYRPLEVGYQLYSELVFTEKCRCGITLNSDKNITLEQRLLFEGMRSHLITAYRNVLKYNDQTSEQRFTIEMQDIVPQWAPRLQKTLKYMLQGFSRKMIADKMDLSIHTLNDYVREIYSKLGVHSHAELIAMFRPDAGGVKK